MNEYFYSPSENAFYPSALKQDYIDANSWPEDLVVVSADIYHEFGDGVAPADKVRVAGADGYPSWGDISVDYKYQAEELRQSKLAAASEIINDWRTELQLGVISDEDKASLVLWMAYIKELRSLTFNDIRVRDAFEAIDWPVSPK